VHTINFTQPVPAAISSRAATAASSTVLIFNADARLATASFLKKFILGKLLRETEANAPEMFFFEYFRHSVRIPNT